MGCNKHVTPSMVVKSCPTGEGNGAVERRFLSELQLEQKWACTLRLFLLYGEIVQKNMNQARHLLMAAATQGLAEAHDIAPKMPAHV